MLKDEWRKKSEIRVFVTSCEVDVLGHRGRGGYARSVESRMLPTYSLKLPDFSLQLSVFQWFEYI
jgi:hypothetical protein